MNQICIVVVDRVYTEFSLYRIFTCVCKILQLCVESGQIQSAGSFMKVG